MAYLTEKKFSFVSAALAEDTFGVVHFKGFEGLSKLYEFEIMLVSDEPEVDLDAVLQNPARFTIHREEGDDVAFNGVLAQFEQLHESDGFVFYKAVIVPKLWWLTLIQHNQVCLDQSVPEIVANTLKDGQLTDLDFKFRTQIPINKIKSDDDPVGWKKMDYVCQYDESHLNFVSRWLEREGIYYFFEQNESGEKVIFTDTSMAHSDLPHVADLYYAPPSALDAPERNEIVRTFTCRQRQVPARVILKEHNYEKPSLEPEGSADVDSNGRGQVYVYGEHFDTPEEGNRLAQIRAEEILCRKREYIGESMVPFMRPGYTFNLQDHYRQNFNQKYLITEIEHEGSQTGYLIAGIKKGVADMEEQVAYRNTFTSIPAEVQFRPERRAQKPRIAGTLHARVDAEGSGDFAELDDQGRYKVRLPFDINDQHQDGKASHFVRMMQPYAGNDYGVHFPLHKGTEVHLSFVDGDPDRPVISGAVPNPETVSPVTSSNQTKSIFRDNYGNELVFDSTPGDEHIRLYSPHHKSGMELGKSRASFTESDTYDLTHGNKIEAAVGTNISAFAGNSIEGKIGLFGGVTIGAEHNIFVGGSHSIDMGYRWDYKMSPDISHSEADVLTTAWNDHIISAGDQLCLVAGGKSAAQTRLRPAVAVGGPEVPERFLRPKSIINAFPEKISFSVGKNARYLGDNHLPKTGEPGKAKGTIFNPKPSTKWIWSLLMTSLFTTIMTSIAMEPGADAGDTAKGVLGGLSGAGYLAVAIMIGYILTKEISDEEIEPVAHEGTNADPDVKIELASQERMAGVAEKKGIFIETRGGAHNANVTSSIEMKSDDTDRGAIHVNSDGVKKEIVLKVGENDASMTLVHDGVNIEAWSNGSLKSTLEIKRNGKVTIMADEINLLSEGLIKFTTQGNKYAKLDGTTLSGIGIGGIDWLNLRVIK